MKIIKSPNKSYIGFCSKSSYNKEHQYRICSFVISLDIENGKILFNNFTKEMICISEEEEQIIGENAYIRDSHFADYLVEHMFIVPIEFDEVKFCEQVRNVIRLVDAKNTQIDSYTILTTTGCNARCYYCFEAGARVYTMSDKMAADVAEYVIKKSQGRSITITWFGGEPLCNVKAIDRISNILNEKGISFVSNMTTNGYLFDDEIITRAANEWHLKRVSITLDGLAETYNSIKSYINNDKNSFNRVINNIRKLADSKIFVHVRMNMTRDNTDELYQLVDFLNNEFANYDYVTPYPAVIYEDLGYKPVKYGNEDRSTLHSDFMSLVKKINFPSVGYKRQLEEIKVYSCQADDPHSIMILPDGRLGFCEHFVDSDAFTTIYEDRKKPFWSNALKAKDKCNICPCYPTCLRLEKCPPHLGELCHDYEQFMRLDVLKRMVQAYYKKHINRERENVDGV